MVRVNNLRSIQGYFVLIGNEKKTYFFLQYDISRYFFPFFYLYSQSFVSACFY